mgnify:CR=1 FL=1
MELNSEEDIFVEGCNTISKLFKKRNDVDHNRIALYEKDYGIWNQITWGEYFSKAEALGCALLDHGLKRQDIVSILSENNKEWCYCDLATVSIGCITNGIYPTDSPEQILYLLQDSHTRVLFVENEEQLDKVIEVWAKLPRLEKVIVFDPRGLRNFKHPKVMLFEKFIDHGEQVKHLFGIAFRQHIENSNPEDLITLIYTSGTTGQPKGAMVDHRNCIFQLQQIDQFMETGDKERQISYLPLCHIAEKLFSIIIPLKTRSAVYFVDQPDTFLENMREISPTLFLGVPRVWEKFYSLITLQMKEATYLGRIFYRVAIAITRHLKKSPNFFPKILLKIIDLIVFRNLRSLMGMEHAHTTYSTAAPVAPELLDWLTTINIPIYEVYGLTESVGISIINTPQRNKIGSIGHSMQRTEVLIAADGEILLKGQHLFQGYWQNPDKTSEVIIDNWLHTGDLGKKDEDGFFWVIGRKKDLIITSGGKNISPGEIETTLKASPYITDAVVIGDQRKYLTCLVMIDGDNMERYAHERQLPFTDFASLCQLSEVQEVIAEIIEQNNNKFSRVEQIKKFRLIEQKLQAEDKELTATMKLKRHVVMEMYSQLIEQMY